MSARGRSPQAMSRRMNARRSKTRPPTGARGVRGGDSARGSSRRRPQSIGRAAEDVAIDIAVTSEAGNLQRAARRLGVTGRRCSCDARPIATPTCGGSGSRSQDSSLPVHGLFSLIRRSRSEASLPRSDRTSGDQLPPPTVRLSGSERGRLLIHDIDARELAGLHRREHPACIVARPG